MSVMLATQNREAAERISPKPMPGCGDTVIYHLRQGAVRAGQKFVPAMVLGVDHDNRQLKLMVIYDHQDMMTDERVPERTGSDYGWEVRPGPDAKIAALRDEVGGLRTALAEKDDKLEAFKIELADTLFGNNDIPQVSFVEQMRDFITTKQLEAAIARLTKKK